METEHSLYRHWTRGECGGEWYEEFPWIHHVSCEAWDPNAWVCCLFSSFHVVSELIDAFMQQEECAIGRAAFSMCRKACISCRAESYQTFAWSTSVDAGVRTKWSPCWSAHFDCEEYTTVTEICVRCDAMRLNDVCQYIKSCRFRPSVGHDQHYSQWSGI